MPAIITDQFRILNAETFIKSFVGVGTTGNNNYYTFLAHPNPGYTDVVNYGKTNWSTDIPDPRDSFQQESLYHDSMLFLKKVQENDVTRVIPRIDWQSGTTYDMYKNTYDGDYLSPISGSTTLYGSNYYVMNSEYRVYICINNGANPNSTGEKSIYEPKFVDDAPRAAGTDGYVWKYLYTISPADVVKFATSKYLPLPKKWGDASTLSVKNAAVAGEIQTIIIKNYGSGYDIDGSATNTIANVPIEGDGTGGKASVKIIGGAVSEVEVTQGGANYTWARLRFEKGVKGGTVGSSVEVNDGGGAEFEVIIPPPGGHGADIYRELGGYRVMVYSKYENNVDDVPDYITDNDFSRVGLIQNPLKYNGTGGSELLNSTTATALSALKLTGTGVTAANFANNAQITQTVSVGNTAIGLVASWNQNTSVLRYYQPVGFSTLSVASFKKLAFTSAAGSGNITGGTHPTLGTLNLSPDTAFNSNVISVGGKNVDLGQTFNAGVAPPDIEKYSGNIIYIDNRAPITRSSSQKEEVKIVVEF
tara:strand:- start:1058 stop:2653 length:1596 start_codon:yes stop_codon:yes gene_type:complete